MKAINLTLLLIVIHFIAHSQSYSPFFSEHETKYSITHHVTCYTDDYSPENIGLCCVTFDYEIKKSDTLIRNGKTYYFSTCDNMPVLPGFSGIEEGLLVREDTLSGKLYRYIPSIEDEVLICDMSLNEGDTFQLFPGDDVLIALWNDYRERGIKLVVDSVRYINGKKVIYFPFLSESCFFLNPGYNISLRFIEGIGPTYGPFGYFGRVFGENVLSLLLCVEKDGSQVFMMHEDLQCYQSVATVKEVEVLKLNIYPNPVVDYVNITSENQDSKIQLSMYDFVGCLVGHYSFQDHIQIPVHNLSSGVYTLIFRDHKNNQSSRKVVINH